MRKKLFVVKLVLDKLAFCHRACLISIQLLARRAKQKEKTEGSHKARVIKNVVKKT